MSPSDLNQSTGIHVCACVCMYTLWACPYRHGIQTDRDADMHSPRELQTVDLPDTAAQIPPQILVGMGAPNAYQSITDPVVYNCIRL